MNTPEIAKCPVCSAECKVDFDTCGHGDMLPFPKGWSAVKCQAPGPQHYLGPMVSFNPDESIRLHNAICRQLTPERERVYEDLATLLGRTDIQDEDGNHECRWCHDYVEAGSDEGFRHSRDCPFEAMKRAADYFAAHPPKPEPTEAVENLDHILDAEHSARILGFPIMACWCCGKPAEVSMADTCARCTDDLCWAHSSWIPVVAWNKRYSPPKPPAEWMARLARELAEAIDFTNDRPAARELFEEILPSLLAKHFQHAPAVQAGMVMVPVEPTEAMLQALHTGWEDAEPDGEWLGEPTISATAVHRASYKAMIAAAPKEGK